MVFHVLHLAMAILVQPVFQSRRIVFEETRFGNATRQKAESIRFGFYELGVFFFVIYQD